MVFLPLILSCAFAPFVFGQTDSTTLQIEAIQAHFSNAGIVPSLLTAFDPSAVFTLTYQGVSNAITPGQSLTNSQVAPTPSLQVTPANSSVSLDGKFTLAMVDAGPVGTDESQGQTRHWLVNGVTLSGSPLNVSTADGTAITTYAGPAPPQGSGAHRYVILLYSQPSTFTAPDGLNTANVGVSVFNFSDYVKNSGLGPLVAGTYITVEEGAASFTPSSTAPVVTSTLPAAQSTASGSSASHTSGSASGSPSATSSTSQGNGARSSSMGMISVDALLLVFAITVFLY